MKFTNCLYATIALASLAGCSADNEPTASGGGKIIPTVNLDTDVIIANGGRSSDISTITADDFSLTLTAANGSASHTWASASEFPSDELWAIGEYILEANHGSVDTEGYDSPCYHGEANVTVTEAAVATPTVTCTLVNSMITLECSEAFKGYFSNYTIKVVTPAANTFDYDSNEVRPLYIKPGNVTLIIDVTKPNGSHATFTPALPLEAEPRHHYRVKLHVNSDNMGEGVLVVNFDNTLSTEDITIDLSDELMNSPAPEVIAKGFEDNTPLYMTEGEALSPVTMTIVARAGLSGVRLSVNSPSLSAKGFPTDCDLMRLTPEQRTAIDILGLKCAGIWGNTDSMAEIDFTQLLSSVTDPHATFTLTAIDNYSKASEPMTLSVTTNAVTVSTADAPYTYVGDRECTVRLHNATPNVNLNAFTLYATLDDGRRITPNITDRSIDNDVVSLTFEIPAGRHDMPLDIYYAGAHKTTTTVSRRCDDFSIKVDPFATKAIITVVHHDTDRASAIARQLDVVGNGRRLNVFSRNASTATVVVAGLSPNTNYELSPTALYGNSHGKFMPSITVTTENDIQLEDPGFEDVDIVDEIVNMPQGGRYSRTHLPIFNHQNGWSYQLYLPRRNWATVNAKTLDHSASNVNTWYLQPSAQIIDDAKVGTKAIKVTSVAYDPAGEHLVDYAQRPDQYLPYNANVPNIRYRAAGKIFLGEYKYDRVSGTEVYDEGIGFASRPTTLNGYYKYIPGLDTPDDRGWVRISLVKTDGGSEQEIGTGVARLAPASGYTAFVIPIEYQIAGIKPDRIKIMIASTTNVGSIDYETSHIITTPNVSKSISTGSALWIDELTFGY